MESIFRVLVVGGAFLAVIFWSLPYYDFMWLTNEEINILDLNGVGAILPPSDIYYWGTLIIWLVISAGLFFYVKISRPAFIIFSVITLVLGFFQGIAVLTPLEYTLYIVITLSDGAIIAIMYLTSISDKFRKSI